ncbi:MAG: hypothetical protein ACYDGR_05745 [Candidatus Dormibacteria bacterium]
MKSKSCAIMESLTKEQTFSHIKGPLNGRGGKKGLDLLCGKCGSTIMSQAPNREIVLLVRCYDCAAVNDLSSLS